MSSEFLPLPVAAGGGSGGGSVDVATSKFIYVMDVEEEITPEPYNMTKPYADINAARDVAEIGDTIIVYPGTYLSALNLAKDDVKWHFHAGATVIYTGDDYLFDTTGFEEDTVITGNAKFHTSGGGVINHSVNSLLFEFYECVGLYETLLNLSCMPSKSINIKGSHQVREESVESYDYSAIKVNSNDEPMNVNISVPKVHSVDANAFNILGIGGTEDSVVVNCNDVYGRILTNTGTWNVDNRSNSVMIVDGEPYGVVQINGNINTLVINVVSVVSLNGFTGAVIMDHSGAKLYGGTTTQLILFGGNIENLGIVSVYDNVSSDISVFGGSASLYLKNYLSAFNLNILGGSCLLKNNVQSTTNSSFITLTHGKVTLDGTFIQQSCDRFITMYEGILDLGMSTIYMSSDDQSKGQIAIYQDGGVILSNGAKIIPLDPGTQPILSTSVTNTLVIKTGGFITRYMGNITGSSGNDIYMEVTGLTGVTFTINDNNGFLTTFVVPGSYLSFEEFAEAIATMINSYEFSGYADYSSGASYIILKGTDPLHVVEISDVSGPIEYNLRNPPNFGITLPTYMGPTQDPNIQ